MRLHADQCTEARTQSIESFRGWRGTTYANTLVAPMPDSFSHSVRLSVTPAEAWPHMQKAATWSGIAGIKEVTDATHDESGTLTGFDFVVVAGGTRVKGTAARLEAKPNELLRLSIKSTEIVGEVAARLAANDASGTKLRIILEMRAKGFLAGMFYPIIAQTVGKGLPEQVEKFGHRLEAGA